MIVVPVGYLGFKYWDKHHRGRRRRGTTAGDNSNSSVNVVEEPPSFREFLKEYLFQKDLPPEGTETTVANSMIQELGGIFEKSSTDSNDEDKLNAALSWSSSGGSSTITNEGSTEEEEQQSDSEFDNEQEDDDDEEERGVPFEGLEYELEQDEEEKEQRMSRVRPINDVVPKKTRVTWAPMNRLRQFQW